MSEAELTASRVREVLLYDQDTGSFTWLATLSNRSIAGTPAGCISKSSGYHMIGLDGGRHQAHRLAWLYVTGSWPLQEIDHIDADRANNRFNNLRDVSFSVNQQNVRRPRAHNTSGYQGVTWIAKRRKWRAQISISGRCTPIGHYDDAKVAHEAYIAAKRELHEGNTL